MKSTFAWSYTKLGAKAVPPVKENLKRENLKGKQNLYFLLLRGTQENLEVRNTQVFGRRVCKKARKG